MVDPGGQNGDLRTVCPESAAVAADRRVRGLPFLLAVLREMNQLDRQEPESQTAPLDERDSGE